ncbi:hypothetical protein V6N13_021503 [Hibiscus sabdariffa]|uniref:Uncharacterized protein n=1 Tax=Hibiscus sabdariffa TaxID=183260 RepID=A0ABR2NPE8_9ROSI
MDQGDPFGWLIDECQMSPSEAFDLQHCSYFGVPDSGGSDDGDRNPVDMPVKPTGISVLSPPDSQDELTNHQSNVPEDQEIFHTPPEFRSTPTSSDNYSDDRMAGNCLDRDGGTVPIEVDSGSAVDLWRDTDLGFMELESEENRVSRRESSPTEALELSDTEELLESLMNATQSPGATIELARETDDGEGNSGRNKNIAGDTDQVRCISENGLNSRAMEVNAKGKRVLPSWGNPRVEPEDDHESADEELVVNGRDGDDERVNERPEVNERDNANVRGDVGPEVLPSLVNGREPVHSNIGTNCVRENLRRPTVLDVLLQLEKDTEEDTSLYGLNLLEVAQQKWGKFV